MKVFHTKNQKLEELYEKSINLERDIQKLVEKNLDKIFNYEFIASEFTIKNRRIDTVAYDPETKSFIIIEYKRDISKSIVDQGLSYLHLLLEYKADFVLKFNAIKNKNYNIKDFDWDQSRILFIAKRFLDYSIEATSFRDMPFELWEVSLFDNDILIFNKINLVKSEYSFLKKDKKTKKIYKEVKVYDINYHLTDKPSYIKELFDQLREGILNIDENIEEKPVKTYIGYKIKGSLFTTIWFSKSRLTIYLNGYKNKYDDPEGLLKDIPKSYQWGERCVFSLKKIEKIPYALHLIKQSCKSVSYNNKS